ncbi:MAG: DUF4412 domain-containing protein [Gammaproteobacteria bacterium]|nr:DUF4412 domain-containing protein [Gammaproteobacteria bacterium]MDH5303745.1 DUF4412 domain-containing protein [Gammaproteobacteria bacterium]MDH5322275.1 DUF4412 domain-containing protein [Gammaproteobacteria bacterium]
MFKETVKTLLSMLLCLLALPALAAHPYERWADEFGIDLNASYDGTRVMRLQGGTFEATEYKAPGKMYTELQMQGMSSGVILREDLGKSYLLMPSMGYYKEESLEGGMMQASNGLEFSKIEKVGTETVNGFPSNKFKTRFKDNDGKGAGFVWVTDSGVPIKMEMIYSNKDTEGARIDMEFIELNLREQDPSVFELPGNLKPMGMGSIGTMMQQGGAAATVASGTPSAYDTQDQDLSARQQACLEEAAAAAAKKQETEKKKRGFGRLMGAMSRTAGRFGVGGNIGEINQDIYDANATANDVAIMAEELGISEADVERCRNPS